MKSSREGYAVKPKWFHRQRKIVQTLNSRRLLSYHNQLKKVKYKTRRLEMENNTSVVLVFAPPPGTQGHLQGGR